MSLDALAASMVEVDLSVIAKKQTTASVYVLIDDGEIIYIGRSVSLISRLIAHRVGTPIDEPKQFDRVLAVEVPIENAAAYEGALIRRFNPPLCVGSPSDESRDAEVLATLGLSFDQASRDAFVARRAQIFVDAHRYHRLRDLARRGRRRSGLSRVLWRATTRWIDRQQRCAS